MKEENYQRACKIKDKIRQLESHKDWLMKNHFMDFPGDLSYQYNPHSSEIPLFKRFIPKDFFDAYVASLEHEIECLQTEFNSL